MALVDNALHQAALATVQRLLQDEASAAQRVAFTLGVDQAEVELGRPGLFDPQAQLFVREYEYRAIRTLTTRQAARIRDAVEFGIREGLNERDLLDRVRQVVHDHEGRVAAIARTEMNRAANWARWTSWQRSGLVREKEYVATLDDRVRPGHLEAHGERVPVDAPFTRGDAAGFLMPPIAPNCRCTAIPVTRFTGLALPAQATTQEIPGLRKVEQDHERDLVMAWNRWPRILDELAGRRGITI